VGDAAARGAPPAWVEPIRSAVRGASDRLPDELDQAVARTDLDVDHRPGWWGAVGVAQSVALAVLLVGLLWLVLYAVAGWLLLPQPPVPEWGALPVPTALVLAGLLGGLLLSLVARLTTGIGARRRGAVARSRLRAAVADAADRVVVARVDAEVGRLRACRDAARRAVA
jgi:hypothetical protein